MMSRQERKLIKMGMLYENTGINEKGHLTFAGVDTTELAKEYGTPLYVMDENMIRDNCRKAKNAIDSYYDGKGMCCYASKAFSSVGMCKIVSEEMLGIDVVSSGELYTALKGGFDPSRIVMHGNFKTKADIAYALESKVGRFVCDSVEELSIINDMAKGCGYTPRVLMRITPGVDAHTHDFIKTGCTDSKFGFTLEDGTALKAAGEVIRLENVKFAGVHCHIGSQIFDIEPFLEAARLMMKLLRDIKTMYGRELEELDIGGGFGIRYLESDDPLSYAVHLKAIALTIKELCVDYGLRQPFLMIEPGRSIVGAACTTLYTAGTVKHIEGVKSYAAVDGGMADNPRFALYGAPYTVLNASRMNDNADFTGTIAGRCCESGDIIQENVTIPYPKYGDIIAVLSTGAYNYSMASNYNRLARAATVMIKDGQARLFIKRESLEDITKNDLL